MQSSGTLYPFQYRLWQRFSFGVPEEYYWWAMIADHSLTHLRRLEAL